MNAGVLHPMYSADGAEPVRLIRTVTGGTITNVPRPEPTSHSDHEWHVPCRLTDQLALDILACHLPVGIDGRKPVSRYGRKVSVIAQRLSGHLVVEKLLSLPRDGGIITRLEMVDWIRDAMDRSLKQQLQDSLDFLLERCLEQHILLRDRPKDLQLWEAEELLKDVLADQSQTAVTVLSELAGWWRDSAERWRSVEIAARSLEMLTVKRWYIV